MKIFPKIPGLVMKKLLFALIAYMTVGLLFVGCSSSSGSSIDAGDTLPAEDGYRLWLRYEPPGSITDAYREAVQQAVVQGDSETFRAIERELDTALGAMLGSSVSVVKEWTSRPAVIIGTPSTSELVRGLGWKADLDAEGPEGFVIRSCGIDDKPAIVIASAGEIGALYGTFHFLRLLQTGQSIEALSINERPRVQLRLLNHWDNLDGSVERGYAGRSLWQWDELPGKLDPRYTDYARVNA